MELKEQITRIESSLGSEEVKYLKLLNEALEDMKPCYFSSTGKYKKQKLERAFCYELYYQIKVRMEREPYVNEGLMISGEIGKQDWVRQSYTIRGLKYKIKWFYPDLVIHKSQEDNSHENQKLVIEAKFLNYNLSELVKDIIKLINAIKYKNFQYAVLLSINTDFNELLNNLKSYLSKDDFSNEIKLLERLLVINIEYNSKVEVKVITLYEMLVGVPPEFNVTKEGSKKKPNYSGRPKPQRSLDA